MMTEANKKLIAVFDKGYRVVDSKVYYKGKQVKGSIKSGYHCVSVRIDQRIYRTRVHRLVGYQKYKDKLFTSNLVLRHVDNNPLNNSEDNIVLGTQSENMLDKPKSLRQSLAIHASSFMKKHDHIEIIKYYTENNVSYKKIMKKFNITSKGTLSYIINKPTNL